jgi:predicted metal-dependent hydrolase
MSAKVQTRRIGFEYPADEVPRHFVSGDLVMSHAVAMLSAVFPEGEDFFVRSVRAYRDDITDATLRDQVKGFVGQEAMHGRGHREFNERLAAMGYPTKGVDKLVGRSLRFRERIQGRRANLAVTAALEHYTATLAETLLSNEAARELFDVPEVRSLFLWHALEESEHKAVAFDVYQHVGGGDRLRRLMMNITTGIFLVAMVGATTVSVMKDPTARRHPMRLARSLAGLRRSPFVTLDVVRRIRDYNRPDFHPNDHDATDLVERWRSELFGADGSLTSRLKTA